MMSLLKPDQGFGGGGDGFRGDAKMLESSGAGAEAPKDFMPTKAPFSPSQRSQPKRRAASTPTRGAVPSTARR